MLGCQSQSLVAVENDAFVLGTFGQIRVYAPSEEEGLKAIAVAFKRITELENAMGPSLVGSDVYNINANAGKTSVQVSDDTLKVIKEGIKYEGLTSGAFNITLGSLIELWGIGKEWQKVPSPADIQDSKEHIEIINLQIDGNKIMIKDPEMLMDLGGIAKGYSVDEAVKVLKANGIKSGFVNLGGDVYAFGQKPDESKWAIGIQKPLVNSNGVVAKVLLENQSIVSSGNYERYFVDKGIRYHHIIDPATGYPSDSGVVSVTIISDSAIDGDALSTAVFILGHEKGMELVEELEGVDAVVITKDNTVYISSGANDMVEILDKTYQPAD